MSSTHTPARLSPPPSRRHLHHYDRTTYIKGSTLHHLILHPCGDELTAAVKARFATPFEDSQMPCSGMSDGWTVGQDDYCPVDDAFVRLEKGKWYGISYHLNNEGNKPGLADYSGFNFTVVPKRELDAVSRLVMRALCLRVGRVPTQSHALPLSHSIPYLTPPSPLYTTDRVQLCRNRHGL